MTTPAVGRFYRQFSDSAWRLWAESNDVKIESMIASELLSQLNEHGYQWRIVSINHLDELREEIEGPHRQGLYDEEFYQERIAPLVFKLPEDFVDAKSLIVVTTLSLNFGSVSPGKEKRGRPSFRRLTCAIGQLKPEPKSCSKRFWARRDIVSRRPFCRKNYWSRAAGWALMEKTMSPTFPAWEASMSPQLFIRICPVPRTIGGKSRCWRDARNVRRAFASARAARSPPSAFSSEWSDASLFGMKNPARFPFRAGSIPVGTTRWSGA